MDRYFINTLVDQCVLVIKKWRAGIKPKARRMVSGFELPTELTLSVADQVQLMAFARAVLCDTNAAVGNFEQFLSNRKGIHDDRPLLELPITTVDVMLWEGGYLRGSQFVNGKILLQGVYEGVCNARYDMRFRPLTKVQTERARIEIAVITGSLEPLTAAAREKNEVCTERAYFGLTNKGKSSWLVPATLNCRSFKDLEQYLSVLTSEKLSVDQGDTPSVKFLTAPVSDFIEGGANREEVLFLRGVRVVSGLDTPIKRTELVARALQFLVHSQREDGSFISTSSPFALDHAAVDWVRSAFLVYALTVVLKAYPDLLGGKAYQHMTTTGYNYLQQFLGGHPSISPLVRCLSLVYLGLAAEEQNLLSEGEQIWSSVESLFPTVPYEPILYTQWSMVLLKQKKTIDRAENYLNLVEADFLRKGGGKTAGTTAVELALYADLPVAIRSLGQVMGRPELIEKANHYYEWFLLQQQPAGSFPGITNRRFAYTRGTSKLLEALTRYQLSADTEAYKGTLRWLHSMQYVPETSYVLRRERERILGGFRHDEQNATAWIDSSAHYLLALTLSDKRESSS